MFFGHSLRGDFQDSRVQLADFEEIDCDFLNIYRISYTGCGTITWTNFGASWRQSVAPYSNNFYFSEFSVFFCTSYNWFCLLLLSFSFFSVCQTSIVQFWSCFVKEDAPWENVRLLGVLKQIVSDAIKRFNQLVHEGDRPERRIKYTVNTPRNCRVIRKRARGNLRVYMRKIARETDISDRLVWWMVK